MSLHLFHKWGKWEVFQSGSMVIRQDPLTGRTLEPHEQYRNGYWMLQKRTCVVCGKAEIEEAYS